MLTRLFILFPCLDSAECWAQTEAGFENSANCPSEGACPAEPDAQLLRRWESDPPEQRLTEFWSGLSAVPLYWADAKEALQVRDIVVAKLKHGD
jgi:hypothetical protein